MRVAVLTVSDRAARGEYADEGGPFVEAFLRDAGHHVAARALVPDVRSEIEDILRSWTKDGDIECIVTTGGTGLGSRDVTPEATRAVIEREIPGIAEAMRAYGMAKTPYAALSRQVAGARGTTLILNLPGAPAAVADGLEAVREILPHAVEMLRA